MGNGYYRLVNCPMTHHRRSGRVGHLLLALILAFAPGYGSAQQPLWEQLIDRGNQALAGGALVEAEAHFLNALQVADQFPPHDLRRVTTARNLAQALMRQGNYSPADSLYGNATTIAAQLLPAGHPYLQTLYDEWNNLRDTMARAAQLEGGRPAPPTPESAFRTWARRLGNGLTPQLSGVLPLGGELAGTHNPGLGYGAAVRIELFELGPLSTRFGLEVMKATLPGKRPAFDPPYVIKGAALSLAPALGPLSLTLGAGLYTVGSTHARRTAFGLAGGVNLALLGGWIDLPEPSLQAGFGIQALRLSNATPTGEPGLFLRGGLVFGFRW